MKSNKTNPLKSMKFWVIAAAVSIGIGVYIQSISKDRTDTKAFSSFIQAVNNSEIQKVDISQPRLGLATINITPKQGMPYTIEGNVDMPFVEKMTSHNVDVKMQNAEESSALGFIFSLLPIFLLIGAMFWLHGRRGGGGSGNVMGFGKSKAQIINPKDITVTFDDVKGCDEAKLEAKEIVDFLKNPAKFKKLGANIPRGLLLIGPPGTGKTLIASAIAKEAEVPYFSLAGSDFVEMFVGVGASRVRDLFADARKHAPCIIFIDEIDSIAGSRGGMGNNEERESTLNQILVEMDGLKNGNSDIIVIGATNMAEKLDAALRPGRFDRRIYVGLPDVKGREQILHLYTKNIPLDTHVDLRKVALYTSGMSGAELKNVVNEACILAAREDSKIITQKHLQEGYDKMSMGVERKNNSLSEKAKLKTAYHEAGHAVVSMMLENHMELHKVTIIPRGQSLGLTRFLPEEDKMYSMQREEIIDQITSTLGGRAAEMLFFNTLTSGASHDIQVATLYARNMVNKYGMSKIGPVAYNAHHEANGYGFNLSEMSEANRQIIENEVVSIIRECEQRASEILDNNRDLVIRMTQALMDLETIEAYHIYNLKNNRPIEDEAGIAEYHLLNEEKEKAKMEKFGIVPNSEIVIQDGEAVEITNDDDNTPPSKTKIDPVEFTKEEFKKRKSILDILGLSKKTSVD